MVSENHPYLDLLAHMQKESAINIVDCERVSGFSG